MPNRFLSVEKCVEPFGILRIYEFANIYVETYHFCISEDLEKSYFRNFLITLHMLAQLLTHAFERA